MNSPGDLNSVLIEDHHQLRQLLSELDHLSASEPLWRSLVGLMITEMTRHVVAEEAYLYPMARERLPDGPRLVAQYTAEHEKIERMGENLESHDRSGEELSLLLSRLRTAVNLHMRAEEDHLFPLIAAHVSEEELTDLGRKAAEAKKASIPLRSADRPLATRAGTGLVGRIHAYLRGRVHPL